LPRTPGIDNKSEQMNDYGDGKPLSKLKMERKSRHHTQEPQN